MSDGGELVPICETCGIPYGPDHEHVDLMAQFFANGGKITMTGEATPKDARTTSITVPVANEMIGKWFKVDEIRIDVDEHGLGTITMRAPRTWTNR
jgi:hypothetical protein